MSSRVEHCFKSACTYNPAARLYSCIDIGVSVVCFKGIRSGVSFGFSVGFSVGFNMGFSMGFSVGFKGWVLVLVLVWVLRGGF